MPFGLQRAQSGDDGLSGNFDPLRVAQELRNQFSEHDVKRRDSARRYQSYIGEAMDFDDDEMRPTRGGNQRASDEGMSEEGIAMVVDAEHLAQEAMATIVQC